MKIRMDFVTNSSSSSYVCEICGEIESGMDLSFAECYDLTACEEGHTFCKRHITNKEPYELITPNDENGFDDCMDPVVPKSHCPICQLDVVATDDFRSYLVKLTGISRDKLPAELKAAFVTYDKFQEYLRSPDEVSG